MKLMEIQHTARTDEIAIKKLPDGRTVTKVLKPNGYVTFRQPTRTSRDPLKTHGYSRGTIIYQDKNKYIHRDDGPALLIPGKEGIWYYMGNVYNPEDYQED
jgi:hypothetical protein